MNAGLQPIRDVQQDYKNMDVNGMKRYVFMCKKCGIKNVFDTFCTSTVKWKLYIGQLNITQRCPKCYVELMRGE
jgi:predicted nucleic-acid-binding Zn-ribbon protein